VEQTFDEPVYTQVNIQHYNKSKNGEAFDRLKFYSNPELFESNFLRFAKKADLLIAGAFWDPKAPTLFSREDVLSEDFRIKVIADITCDIEGSIPSTKQPSTIAEPLYDFNAATNSVETPLSSDDNITVMAVDNLPCELPRNASEDFGRELINNVLPHLLGDDSEEVIKRATITENGKLTKKFAYLQDFVDGK